MEKKKGRRGEGVQTQFVSWDAEDDTKQTLGDKRRAVEARRGGTRRGGAGPPYKMT